jgi:hypothetical protein
MTNSYNEAFNAFASIASNCKRSGPDKATGDCPICHDHSLKLWRHPSGAKAWIMGCNHRNHCTFAPLGLLSWCWSNRRDLWTQLKQAAGSAPSASVAPALPVSATWADENNAWICGYMSALQPLGDQAFAYVQARKLPESEYSKWKWSKRTSAIVIPIEDRKGRFVGAKRRFLAAPPGKPRWSVVTEVIADGKKQRIHQPPVPITYGLHRVDPRFPVIICEGTFDALAFSNGVSIEGLNNITADRIDQFRKRIPERIWCLDNDDEGRKKARFLREHGEHVMELPGSYKDANEFLCGIAVENLDAFTIQEPLASRVSSPKAETLSGFENIFNQPSVINI